MSTPAALKRASRVRDKRRSQGKCVRCGKKSGMESGYLSCSECRTDRCVGMMLLKTKNTEDAITKRILECKRKILVYRMALGAFDTALAKIHEKKEAGKNYPVSW